MRVTTSRENATVRLSGPNTGIGIAEANLARIFDPSHTPSRWCRDRPGLSISTASSTSWAGRLRDQRQGQGLHLHRAPARPPDSPPAPAGPAGRRQV